MSNKNNRFFGLPPIRYGDISRNLLCQMTDCWMNIDSKCIYPLKEEITLIKVGEGLLQCCQYHKE
jgi:hypothetical protein